MSASSCLVNTFYFLFSSFPRILNYHNQFSSFNYYLYAYNDISKYVNHPRKMTMEIYSDKKYQSLFPLQLETCR